MTDNDTSTTKPSANGDDYVNDGTPKDTRKREHVDGDQSPSLDSKRSKRSRGDDSGAKENSPEKNEEHKKTEDDANGVKSDKKEKSKDKEKKEKKKERKDDRKSRDKDKERRRSDRDDRDRKKERKERDMHDKGKERDRDRTDRRETMEEGEISEHAVKREPSARDLERRRQYEEELKKEQAGAIPEEEDRPVWSLVKAQAEASSRQCPYLDTIDRNMLDFDFEKLCSVSLSHLNVYACMICGKYFQGRGTSTHAYTHSLDTDHRVFLNLQTLKFYCLPDMYEVIDPSLDDVKYVLKPTFSDKLIRSLDSWTRPTRAYDNTSYFPGVVGLNNIKENDYENVILHALSHVPPLRDYFLKEENYANIKRPPGDKLELLTKRFGELVRKLWNTKAFKAHVSPHEMLQSIVITSKKRFQFIKQGDASEFLSFLLNTLHIALNGTQKTSSSIIYKSFRGRMRQYTRKVLPVDASEEFREQMQESDEYKEEVKEMPFLYLSLDLPPAPLYRDAQLQNIIPQVPLSTLLTKFNGEAEKEYKTYKENFMKRFELLSLPEYLIIVYQRFRKNQFFVEKNPTIVNFPISNVDLYDCLAPEVRANHKYTTYDLVSNIVHDGKPRDSQQGTEGDEGHYRVQIHHKGSGKWFELEDLHVKDILPQMITLAESYIQVWQLNRTKTRDERINEDEGELEEAPIDPLSVLVKQAQEASTKKEEKVEDR